MQISENYASAAENGVINFYDQQGIYRRNTERVIFARHVRSWWRQSFPDRRARRLAMFGIGATDMLGVLVTGETWVRVPETIQINWSGELPAVSAKDMALKMR